MDMYRRRVSRRKRHPHGGSMVQLGIFALAFATISSIGLDIYRGWSIVDSMQKYADTVTSNLAGADYDNYNEQLAAVRSFLTGKRYIKDANEAGQFAIEWLDASSALISTSGKETLPVPINSDLATSFGGSIVDRVRVRVNFVEDPQNNMRFPNGFMRAVALGNPIPISAYAVKKFMNLTRAPRHFRLKPRLEFNTTTPLYICPQGAIGARVDFWNFLCQEAAKLTDVHSASLYRVSGLTKNPADDSMVFGADASSITPSAITDIGFIFSADMDNNSFDFVNNFDCRVNGALEVVDEIACYPDTSAGYSAPNPMDLRYLIIDASFGITNGNNVTGARAIPYPNSTDPGFSTWR